MSTVSFRPQMMLRWYLALLAGMVLIAALPQRADAQCDAVQVTYYHERDCDWFLQLQPNNLPNLYRIHFTPQSPVTLTSASPQPGMTTSFSSSLAVWQMAGGTPFPQGALVPLGLLGLNPNGAIPQIVIVEFYDNRGNLLCREELVFDCPTDPPIGCGEIPDTCWTDRLILSTGYDHTINGAYPPPTQDAYWSVVGAPNWANLQLPRPAEVIFPLGSWFTGTTAPPSQWISAFAQSGSNAVNMPPETPYTFERCFCICETDGWAHIYLEVYADNIASVYFDGQLIGQTNQNSVPANFQSPTIIDVMVPVSGPGTHCLTVELHNDHASSPMGLRVSGWIDDDLMLRDVCCNPRAAITGTKYWDKNCSGKRDEPSNVNLEPGLQGWTIELYDQGGNLVATTVTDVNGYYAFNNLPAGTYTVCEVQQAGWVQSQPQPAGSCYTVTINNNQVVSLDFGNCREEPPVGCEDEFGDGGLDSVCCDYTLGISNAPGNIIGVNYQITGGLTNYVFSSPCTPTSTTPTSLFGQPSGTLNYNPACNSSLNVNIGVSPTTASGLVQIHWTVYYIMPGGEIDSCEYDSEFYCMRMPVDECDTLSVQPFVYAGLDMSGRTFTITNSKVPAAPICKVLIALDPPPNNGTYQWAGGGLVVDGQSRSWSFPYTSIDLNNGGNVSPSGAANNTIQFNLGVDYTLNWTGTVKLTVIHCDGDTCELEYTPWCALPDPADCAEDGTTPDEATLVDIDKDNLYVAGIELSGTSRTKWISIAVENEEDALFAAGSEYSDDSDVALVLHGVAAGNHALYEVRRTAGTDAGDFTGVINLVVKRALEGDLPTVRWTSYDEDGNPFATGLVETTPGAITVGAGDPAALPATGDDMSLIRSVPNPADGETTVYYRLNRLMDVKLELYDAVGNLIDVIQSGVQPSGTNSVQYGTSHLQSGVYYLRLTSGGHTVSMPLTVIR